MSSKWPKQFSTEVLFVYIKSYIFVFNLFEVYLTTPSAAQAVQYPKVIRLVNNKLERAGKKSAGG